MKKASGTLTVTIFSDRSFIFFTFGIISFFIVGKITKKIAKSKDVDSKYFRLFCFI